MDKLSKNNLYEDGSWYILRSAACNHHNHLDGLLNNYNTPLPHDILNPKDIHHSVRVSNTNKYLCFEHRIYAIFDDYKTHKFLSSEKIKIFLDGKIQELERDLVLSILENVKPLYTTRTNRAAVKEAMRLWGNAKGKLYERVMSEETDEEHDE